MPPPPRQQQGFDPSLALRYLQQSDPAAAQEYERLRALVETQTPAQQAQFQQRYAQATPPPVVGPDTVMTLPNGMQARGGVVLTNGGADPFESPLAPPVRTDAVAPPVGWLPPASPIDPDRVPARNEAGTGARLLREPEAPRGPTIGGAPEGGDGTFGDVGSRTAGRPERRAIPNALPTDRVTGGIAALPDAEGGGASRVEFAGLSGTGPVYRAPGVDAPIIPPVDDLPGWAGQALANYRAIGRNGVLPNGQVALDQATLDTILSRVQGDLQGAAAPAGPGGPVLDATVRRDIVTPGRVTPETAARLAAAGLDTARGQGAYQAAEAAMFAGHEAAGGILGAEQEAAALEQAAQAQEHAQRLDRATQTLNRRIDDVAGRRVSVEEAFGGFGGRIGAGIAVALGQLGSALGGGENAALGIVNSMIDRNLRAQEANIQNERAGVAAAGNALAQMRQVFSDEEAAQQAARSMHLTAVASQLNGMLAGLSGNHAESVRNLQRLMLQESQVARQAALEIESTTQRARVSARVRGPADRVLGEIGRLSGVQQGAPGATTGAAPSRASAGGSAPSRPRAPAAGTPQQPAQVQGPQGASERYRVPRGVDLAESVESARSGLPPALPSGTRFLRAPNGESVAPDAMRRWAQMSDDPALRERIRAATANAELWSTLVPEITRINDQFEAEVTNGEPDVATARAMASLLRERLVHQLTGAQRTDAEMERWARLLPDPNSITIDNLTSAWRSIRNSWNGMARSMMNVTGADLHSVGLEFQATNPMNVSLYELAEEQLDRRAEAEAASQERARREAERPGVPDWLGFGLGPLGLSVQGLDLARRALDRFGNGE